MDDAVRRALECDRTVEITTRGRRSGEEQRIEIWFHNLDGRLYITGLPGRRGWYANLRAQPEFTFHLKESTVADLPARARAIVDPDERRAVLERILARLGRETQLGEWVARSPLVEVELAA